MNTSNVGMRVMTLFIPLVVTFNGLFLHCTESDPEIERLLLQLLSDSALLLPINSVQLIEKVSSRRFKPVSLNTLSYFLQKFATQSYIRYWLKCWQLFVSFRIFPKM